MANIDAPHALPHIIVIATGGTISMTKSHAGIVPSLTANDLLASVPGLSEVAHVEAITPFVKPGASLRLSDVVQIVSRVNEAFAQGCCGAVIIQGTDTIEETAFLYDLLYRGPSPIVITGAMRGADAASADGAGNLLAAVRVAACASSRNRGALVVLNDEIHAAPFVQKAHTIVPNAFRSPITGPLGLVVEGKPRFFSSPHSHVRDLPPFALHAEHLDDRVAILPVVFQDDGSILDALPGLGFKGLVVQGMGVGHVPQDLVCHLARLSTLMPVVLSSRIGHGFSTSSTYGFAGSERDLLSRGLISAGWLDSLKARLLLMLLLSTEASRADIEAAFAIWQ